MQGKAAHVDEDVVDDDDDGGGEMEIASAVATCGILQKAGEAKETHYYAQPVTELSGLILIDNWGRGISQTQS